MVFADVEDLEARWRVLSDAETVRAATLLGDAEALIATEFSRLGVPLNPDDPVLEVNLRRVTCAVVKRAMASGADEGDFKQVSLSAGPFSQAWTPNNPSDDLYLTSAERQSLGIPRRKARVGSIMPSTRLDWTTP